MSSASSKPLPAILNRKRKNDQEDPTQPDLHNYFSTSSKDEMVENMQGVSFSSISRRPLTSSRVPLSTLSISSDNVAVATSMGSTNITSSSVGAFALKLPGSNSSRHHSEPVLAVDFIDRFLSLSPSVPKNRLQLIGVSCLFIGAKIEEIYPPKLQEFAYVTDGACTEEEILNMELMILKGLNWGLSPMTPNAWMRMYLQILHGSKSPNDDSFSLPAYSGLPFSRVMQLLDLAVLDVGSLEFSYSVLATSALYHAENEEVALSVSGYKWEDIGRCVRWMAAFSFALRERSPLQPKSFHGVQPDDAHHLQTHSIDLQLLERAQEQQQALCANVLRESPDPMAQAALAPTGLDNTPQEGEGDIMYPSTTVSSTCATTPVSSNGISNMPNSALMSPPLDSDIW